MYQEFSYTRRFLCVTDVIGMPDPIPEEFSYIVCVPRDGVLCFHSGYYTSDAAVSVASTLVEGVVLRINLKGIVDYNDNGTTTEY